MPHIKYAMDYRPRNSLSMSYASCKVIFPGVSAEDRTCSDSAIFTEDRKKTRYKMLVELA